MGIYTVGWLEGSGIAGGRKNVFVQNYCSVPRPVRCIFNSGIVMLAKRRAKKSGPVTCETLTLTLSMDMWLDLYYELS